MFFKSGLNYALTIVETMHVWQQYKHFNCLVKNEHSMNFILFVNFCVFLHHVSWYRSYIECNFMQNSVEYLGCLTDVEGVHTSPRKMQAIVNAIKLCAF